MDNVEVEVGAEITFGAQIVICASARSHARDPRGPRCTSCVRGRGGLEPRRPPAPCRAPAPKRPQTRRHAAYTDRDLKKTNSDFENV